MRLIFLIISLLFFPNIVQAYVDPGSLSIIAQVVGSFFVKHSLELDLLEIIINKQKIKNTLKFIIDFT